jgi:hypothetical protein
MTPINSHKLRLGEKVSQLENFQSQYYARIFLNLFETDDCSINSCDENYFLISAIFDFNCAINFFLQNLYNFEYIAFTVYSLTCNAYNFILHLCKF